MNSEQSEYLLSRLSGVLSSQPSEELSKAYMGRLRLMEFAPARLAIDRIVDKWEFPRFPPPAVLNKEYSVAREDLKRTEKTCQRKADPPMTPVELREVAEMLAGEVVRRVQTRGHDPMAKFVEDLADTYARNATLRAEGKPTRPIPKVSSVLEAIAAQANAAPPPKPEPKVETPIELDAKTAAMACRLCGDPYGNHMLLKRDFLAVRCGDVVVKL